MKIKNGFEMRNVCGEHVIVATGRENIDFSKVISLNESAADLFTAMEGREFEVDDMVKALTDIYDVDEATARQDAQKVAQQWLEIGLIS